MTGETWALAAAAAYGLAGVSIAKGKVTAQGDNGLYLAILMTAFVSGAIWVANGTARPSDVPLSALAFFVFAGVLSTVLGRLTMYRATEALGAVSTSLLRRLIPLFALPAAWLVLHETPTGAELCGGALILCGVILYLAAPLAFARTGLLLGIASAVCYALAYVVRGMGLQDVPDPAFGTMVGALVGCIWFFSIGLTRKGGLQRLFADRGLWQWTTALALSFGQLMQFVALSATSVASVAVLGAMDVLFAALIGLLLGSSERTALLRLLPALALALVGTAVMVG